MEVAQRLHSGHSDTNAARAASHRCLQGAQSMAKPHDTRDQDAFQDPQMVTALSAALQEIDDKTALQGSLYALKIKPLILIESLNMKKQCLCGAIKMKKDRLNDTRTN